MGTLKVYDGTLWQRIGSGAAAGGGSVTVDPSEPATPSEGDLWYDTDAAAGTAQTIATGTAFPASPSTGDRYRRCDLDYMVFFYDGTDWLSEQMFTADAYTNYPGNASTEDQKYHIPIPQDLPIRLVKWDAMVYVGSATTWVLDLESVTFDATETSLDSISTAALSGNSYYNYTRTLGDDLDGTAGHSGTNITGLFVYMDEQAGSTTFLGGARVYYRYNATAA